MTVNVYHRLIRDSEVLRFLALQTRDGHFEPVYELGFRFLLGCGPVQLVQRVALLV